MATNFPQRAPQRPNLGGSIMRNGVTTNYAPSAAQNLDPNRAGSGGSITMGGVTRSYAPTAARAPLSTGVTPAAMQFLQDGQEPDVAMPAAPDPNYNTYSTQPQRQSYATFLARNPGSPAATGSLATPYNPPQQTERANPLSGANNRPMEEQSQPIQRPPFIQRGSGVPSGQDAAPVRQTLSQDEDIGTSMQGTFDRLRGIQPRAATGPTGMFSRRYGAPAPSPYSTFLQRSLA